MREAGARRSRRLWQIGSLVAVVAVVGLAVAVRLSSSSAADTPVSPQAVTSVSTTAFPSSGGGTVNLDSLKGSKVVLYFYEGQSCGACQTQLTEYQSRAADFAGAGAKIVAVTTDPVGVSTSVAQQLHLSYPILEDQAHMLGDAFGTYEAAGHMGAVDQHSVIVLGADGSVRWRQLAGTTMYVSTDDVLTAVRGA